MATQLQEELIGQVLEAVLTTEGGYVNDPADPGGATNHGITLATLADHRGAPVTPADVEAMPVEEARAIYRARYIEKPGFLGITNSFLFYFLVDTGVNSGPTRAIKILQRALGVKEDGVLGPITISKANATEVGFLARRVVGERIRFIGRLISGDHKDVDHDGMTDSAEFAAGWSNRLADFVERLP